MDLHVRQSSSRVAIPTNTHQYPPIPPNTLPIPSQKLDQYPTNTLELCSYILTFYSSGFFVVHERPSIRCSTVFSSFNSLLFLFLCSYCSASSSIRLLSCFARCSRRNSLLLSLPSSFCSFAPTAQPHLRFVCYRASLDAAGVAGILNG